MVSPVGPKSYFDVRVLSPEHKIHNPVRRREFESALAGSDGSALALIHPLFLQRRIHEGRISEVIDNYFLLPQVTAEDYGRYLARLNAHLRQTEVPMFVFTEPGMRETVEQWLAGLELTAPAALVNTKPADPSPDFEDIADSWAWLIHLVKGLPVRKVDLAGEIAFTEGGEGVGCVYAAELAFYVNFGVTIQIIPELTYPNLRVSYHSRK